MSYVIAISNVKGGVAKTSTAIALGRGLSKMGYRVLLVDLDPQADLTLSVGINLEAVSYSSKDFFIPGILKKINISHFLLKTSYENLDILPSNGEVLWNDQRLADFDGSKHVLKAALKIEDEAAYNFVVIDCPPAISTSTISALMAANLLIIPTQAEYFSANSLMKMISVIRHVREDGNPELKYKVLVTMLDLRNRIQRTALEEFRKGFKENLLKTVIVIDTKIRESHTFRVPIVDYKPNSRGATQYMALVAEIIETQAEIQHPTPATTLELLEEVQTEETNKVRCPFLGLKDDLNSMTDYPSPENYCHRAKPNASPKLDYQRENCLSGIYLACPMLKTRAEQPLPAHLQEHSPNIWQKLGF
jgi:chromosome partitioning protein